MAEMISIPKEQLERLYERTRKLALEKSHLQLVNNLMNSLSTEPGLENTVEAILRLILDNVGGTNVAIYYLKGSTIHYADVCGEKKILETVDDHLVRQAFEEKQSFEEVRDFVDTKKLTPEFTKAACWAFPLMVGERMIGAIKMEGMLMAAMDIRTQLQPFINYAALVLKNEIESDSRLMQAYDQLRRANEELKKSEYALRCAIEGLEAQATDHTVELRRANEQMQFELTERKRAEERFRDLYENAPNAYFSVGTDGLIRRCNRRAGELLGYTVEELVGRPVIDLYAATAQGKEEAAKTLHRFRAGETVRDRELVMKKADGTPVWISLTVNAIRDNQGRIVESRSMVMDISERKRVEHVMQARLRLLELANSCSMDELLTATLDEIEALTGSTIGFYHFLESDQRTLSLQSWSTNTLKTMCTAAGKGRHYDVAQAGVWVDCIRERGPVIHNDYASLPHRKGLPEGHAPVIREVVVPIFRGNLIKAIIGVGNKSINYAENDIEIVSQLGDLSWDIVERMRAEEALKQAEEKYRSVFENAVEGIFQTTPEGRYLDANPALARIHGYDSPQELIASVIDIRRQHYVNPGDRTEFQKAMEQHGIVKDFETEQYRKDASKIWVSVTARAVLGPDGQVRCYEGTVEDITERRRMAEALRDSEARYRAIVEAFEGLIYVCSQDYRVEFMNEELITRTGYDATGELCYKTLHERDSICPWCVNERVFKGETVRWEVKSPKDERWYYVVNTPIYRPDGRMSKQAMIMDISDRKRAEEALRKANEALRATLEAAPVAIFDLDTEGHVKSIWNRAAEELLGWRREEVIGRFLPSVREENKEKFALFREWMRTGKRMLGQDVVRRRKDGSLIEYSIYAAPEYDDDSKVIGNIAVLVDITERKRAEEEIRKLNIELEQRVKDRTADLEAANKELEAFAYSVSHDLRAPLRHIDGFVELLQKRMATAMDERGRHYLAEISDSARRMGTLIDDLLSFSHMGRHEMSKTRVDLGSLVLEVIMDFQPEVEGRDIRWLIADLPVVTGDRAMLRIVLVNLISNTLKFTRPRERAEIEIGCMEGAEAGSVVYVRDNGVGFDMNYADKLFGVFQRLHRIDEFEGTGIGLATVRRIIDRHGGRTWAEGKIEQGATFYISLPNALQGSEGERP